MSMKLVSLEIKQLQMQSMKNYKVRTNYKMTIDIEDLDFSEIQVSELHVDQMLEITRMGG